MRSSLQRLRTIYRSRSKETSITDEVRNILETDSPVECALESLASRLSPRSFKAILRHQLSKPDPQLGLRFFIWATSHDRLRHWECFNLVVDVLLRDNGSGFDLYWSIVEEFKRSKVRVNSNAFQPLIEGYSKLQMTEQAMEAFGRMTEFDCSPNVYTYNKLLVAIMEKKVFLLALAVYNRMCKSDCFPNSSTYTTLIDGFRKGGLTTDACKMFDEMIMRGVSPTPFTYTSVVMALCRGKITSYPLKLLELMKVSGYRFASINCNGILSGFFKAGRVDEGLVLLQVFIKGGYALGLAGYSSVIDGLFRVGRYDQAQMLYEKLLKFIEPDIVLYGIMIRGLSEARRFDDALRIISQMTERGVLPNAYCYNALIKGYCDVGLLDMARSLHLKIVRSNNFTPNPYTYTILICGMCKEGLVTDAQCIFNEMEKIGCLPSVVTFNSLMNGLCKAGNLEEAGVLLSKMAIGKNPSIILRLQLSQGSSKVPDSENLQMMVERFCETGLILKAYRLLMRLIGTGAVPDLTTYNILINGLCKSGKVSAALKIFRELQMGGPAPDSVTYGTLIDGLYRIDREEDALKVFDLMEKNDCTPNSPVYKCVMTWSCRRGKVSLAFSLWLRYLKSLPLQGQGLETIRAAEESFEKGEVEKAVRAVIEFQLTMEHFDIGFYTILLIGMCQGGRIRDSFGIFCVLKDFKVSISPSSCTKLIQGACEDKKLDLAIAVFSYTLEKGFILRPRVCNELLESLLYSDGRRRHAIDLIDRMKLLGYDLDRHLYKHTKGLLRQSTWKRASPE